MTQQRDPDTYDIIGAAMTVHTELGSGFLEAVYQEALERELTLRNIPFIREPIFRIRYRGEWLSRSFRVDLLVRDRVLVELKAMPRTTGLEEAQVINYMKASGIGTALLINFGNASLDYRRMVRSAP